MRYRVLAAALVLGGMGGCKRAAPAGEAADSGAPGAVSSARGEGDGLTAAAAGSLFSLPIAGARLPGEGGGASVAVVGAGLVVATRSITATRLDASGTGGAGGKAWTRVLVSDVSWSADAELHAWPIGVGAAVVWRGPVGKKSGHVAVVVRSDGQIVDGPFDVGSLVCATDDGLAWSEAGAHGSTRVHLRSYAPGAPPRDDTGAGTMEDFTLTCAGRTRPTRSSKGTRRRRRRCPSIGDARGGTGQPFMVTLAPLALGKDEERDLFAWAHGDELGLVRVASGGDVQAATVHAGGYRLISAKGRVTPEDDVVGVDADARQVVLVTTHDESDACPNGRGGGERPRAPA